MNGRSSSTPSDAVASWVDDEPPLGMLDMLVVLQPRWRQLVLWPIVVTLAAFALTYLIKPSFTARSSFIPPQGQSGAAAAMASLGSLASILGGGAVKTSADQYVSLMQSATVSDRMIDRFKLLEAYDQKYRVDARKELASNVVISVGKKDGLIAVEVTDHDPQRSADMANRYVEELRLMASEIAMTEAQQRRQFFEQHLKSTRDALTKAQMALQDSGVNQGTLKAEPKAAAEGYAKLRAELTTAEVRLQALRRAYADHAPEIQQQSAVVGALRGQLARLEQTTDAASSGDYVTKFREYKYQETLFDLFARQYELARVDESRESTLIQVVDKATPPEKKSKPKRSIIAAVAGLASLAWLVIWYLTRHYWQSRAPLRATRPA